MVRACPAVAAVAVAGIFAILALFASAAGAAAPPTVTLSPYLRLAASAVKLRGFVDPHGEETTYYFEYGSASCEGAGACASVPASQDAAAGASGEAVAVSRQVNGLAPDTTYHFRLRASSSAGSASTPDATFTTPQVANPEPSGSCPNEAIREEQGVVGLLPECRAYELVSRIPAPSRAAVDVGLTTERTRAAVNGEALEFLAAKGTDGVESLPGATEYVSARAADGWQVHGIFPEQGVTYLGELIGVSIPQYEALSPDLAKGVFLSNAPLNDEGSNVAALKNLYLREDLLAPGGGSYRLLSDSVFPQEVGEEEEFRRESPEVAAVTPDFSHILFESRRDLTADSQSLPAGPRLYEWVAGAGLRFAGILPASEGGGPSVSQAGRGALRDHYTDRTLSSDGSRFVFTASPNEQSGGRLYLREDAGTPEPGDDSTVAIDTSEKTNGSGPEGTDSSGRQPATFWTATPDLSQIFFTSGEALTNDAPEGEPSVQKLYRYEPGAPAGHRLSLISVDSEPADGVSDEAEGAIGVSDDGSYVYFVGSNQLQAGGPTAAAKRIFVWHEGEVREVGAINGGRELERVLGAEGTGRWAADGRWSRVSPDGRELLFVSQGTSELTGYDQGSSCPEGEKPGCTEVYVYQASPEGPGNLQCASCNPTGQAATRDADVDWRPEDLVTAGGDQVNRALSADGRLVFFTSGERLVSGDEDDKEDAYAYDTVTGQVRLFSGEGGDGSFFLDASGDGRDSFFLTGDRLIAGDSDELRDVYDARVDGGFAEAPASAPPCASAGECRPSPAAIAPSATPPSETQPGRDASRARVKHRHRRHHHHGHGAGRHSLKRGALRG